MKTLAAIALSGLMLIAVPAFGQTLIGEWQLVKSFCEDGKVLDDWSRTNNHRIFDKVSTTQINDMSHLDEGYKTTGCALHIKTNYSVSGNQYTAGPFMELASPKCPKIAGYARYCIRHSVAFLKEKYGNISESSIDQIKSLQAI